MKDINIIAISGYIGSGKDTVAKIIQYLTSDFDKRYKQPFYPNFEQYGGSSDWQVKKFAGKLKQIASIITGIPREKFEDQEFKKMFLGNEWDKYYNPEMGEKILTNVGNEVIKMSIRDLLQKLGTEAMRDGLHTNVWVNALFADYEVNCCGDPRFCPDGDGEIDGNCAKGLPKWIISDLRFGNEFDAVKERDGICVRVNRPNINKLIDSGIDVQKHPSETSLDNHDFDWEIDNNGTIEDLVEKVRVMLLTYQII